MRVRQRSSAGGLQVLFFQQYAGATPVYGSTVKAAIDAEGRVRLATFSNPAPGVQLANPSPSLSAAQAARLALESLQVEVGASLEPLPAANGRAQFAHPDGPRRPPVAAELTAFPLPSGQARLAWRIFADAAQPLLRITRRSR